MEEERSLSGQLFASEVPELVKKKPIGSVRSSTSFMSPIRRQGSVSSRISWGRLEKAACFWGPSGFTMDVTRRSEITVFSISTSRSRMTLR